MFTPNWAVSSAAAGPVEAVPEAARNEDFNQLLSQLKSRKTENRTDLPGLRKQMEAMMAQQGVSVDGKGGMRVKSCVTPEMAARSDTGSVGPDQLVTMLP